MHAGFRAQVAHHPFNVAGCRQLPRAARIVAEPEDEKLHGSIHGDINGRFGMDAVIDMLEHAIAKTVTCNIRLAAAERPWHRGPEFARRLVADIERLAAAVADGIVDPRRQAEGMRVLAPCVGGAGFGYDGAEMRIGDDVDPGRGRLAVRACHDDVFAAIGAETAGAVE